MLRCVELCCGNGDKDGDDGDGDGYLYQKRKALRPLLKGGDQGLPFRRGAFQLLALFATLYVSSTYLHTLSFGYVDWCFFTLIRQSQFDIAAQMVRDLRAFRMRLFMKREGRYWYGEVLSAGSAFRMGRPGVLVRGMGELRDLEVVVKRCGASQYHHAGLDDNSDAFEIADLVGQKHIWPSLRRFSIEGFRTTQHEFVGFLIRHRGTLRVVELRNGRMEGGGRWMEVFKFMRRGMVEIGGIGGMRLEDCRLEGLWNKEDRADCFEEGVGRAMREFVLRKKANGGMDGMSINSDLG